MTTLLFGCNIFGDIKIVHISMKLGSLYTRTEELVIFLSLRNGRRRRFYVLCPFFMLFGEKAEQKAHTKRNNQNI